MFPLASRSAQSCGNREPRRRAAPLALTIEPLETRLMPAAGLNVFAHFAGAIAAPHDRANVAVHVREDEFHLPRGGVRLGFALEGPAGSTVAPVVVQTLAPGRLPRGFTMPHGTNVAADPTNLTVARVEAGTFVVRILGHGPSTGSYTLDVFLAGDANADFQVDRQDVALIRSLQGLREGDPGYVLEADANRNGRIGPFDLRVAQRNRGASTTVRPLTATLGLAPDSDPDGNGVVLRSEVALAGQTTPGATVRLDQANDGRFEQQTVADDHGRYQFGLTVAAGANEVRVAVIDPFGQHQVVEQTVTCGDVILDWNAVQLTAIRDYKILVDVPFPHRIVPTAPPRAARNLAIVHAAMYDAVNAAQGSDLFYHVNADAPAGTSAEAAAAAAAHRLLLRLYPDPQQAALFDAALAESLAAVPDGAAEENGVHLGEAIADNYLAWRGGDGSSAVVRYTPGSEPGDWGLTPPDFLPPLVPQWGNVTPFALTSPDQFAPPGPPALDSPEYAAALNEVKELGRFDSPTRTAEQTEIALFWADGPGTFTPAGHWNQIAQGISLQRGLGLAENAQLFALLNIALADAGIACWRAKYDTGFWRPIAAVRQADQDGNPLTAPDPTWIPLLKTPNFPTYTSGHSTFSGAAEVVLTAFFGVDVAFTDQSDGHTGFAQRPLAETVNRSFTSFAQAAEEAARSRVYGGIHFEFDSADGLAQGRAIGQHVVQTLLTSDNLGGN